MQTNTQKTRILVTMIALAATAVIGPAAQAGDAGRTGPSYGSVVVKYSDLDLDSVAGNKVLYARLSAAAERACGKEQNTKDLKRRAQYRACYESTLDRAVDKVGSRELQALHEPHATHTLG